MVERVWGVWECENKLKNIYLHHYNAGLPIINYLTQDLRITAISSRGDWPIAPTDGVYFHVRA